MEKQAIRDFLERQIEITWKEYKEMRSLEGLKRWLESAARQTREEQFREMEERLNALQFLLLATEKYFDRKNF